MALVDKNLHLVATLAAHFRSVTKGYIPFTLDWYSDPVILMAGREEVALDYMRTVGQWVKESGKKITSSPNVSRRHLADRNYRASFAHNEFCVVQKRSIR